jgi:hypothetical protein
MVDQQHAAAAVMAVMVEEYMHRGVVAYDRRNHQLMAAAVN